MSRRESNPPQGKRGTRIDFSSALLAPYKLPKDVFNAFPSANNDILEASNCLALERGTATVMHLMRVAEVGLKALASALGVTLGIISSRDQQSPGREGQDNR